MVCIDKAFEAHVTTYDLHFGIEVGQLAQRFDPKRVGMHPEQADTSGLTLAAQVFILYGEHLFAHGRGRAHVHKGTQKAALVLGS